MQTFVCIDLKCIRVAKLPKKFVFGYRLCHIKYHNYYDIIFRRILETLGGKQRVMILLAHTDPNVRYEALLAVQKIMVHNWSVSYTSTHNIVLSHLVISIMLFCLGRLIKHNFSPTLY